MPFFFTCSPQPLAIWSKLFCVSNVTVPVNGAKKSSRRSIASAGRSVVCGTTFTHCLAPFSLPICRPFKRWLPLGARKVLQKFGMTHYVGLQAPDIPALRTFEKPWVVVDV